MPEKIVRIRVHGESIRFHDGAPVGSHARLERSLYPNADPGDPNAGTPVEDDGEEITVERIAGLCEKLTTGERAALVTILQAEAVESTPVADFRSNSNRMRGINDHSLEGNFTPSQIRAMTPSQRFTAASNLKWGIGARR